MMFSVKEIDREDAPAKGSGRLRHAPGSREQFKDNARPGVTTGPAGLLKLPFQPLDMDGRGFPAGLFRTAGRRFLARRFGAGFLGMTKEAEGMTSL